MSSDNGYSVLPVDDKPNHWGIFYYSGESDSTTALSKDAREIVSNPITAIIRAHRINDGYGTTEYGVYVSEECLRAAELTMVEYLGGKE